MPFLIERFTNVAREDFKEQLPGGFLPEAQKFYYDTAQATNTVPMTALKLTVPVSQILFGTDFPYRRSVDHVEGLRANGVFSEAELAAIDEISRELGRMVLNTRLYETERRLVAELQEIDRYKGELIATISHELKTPLTSIIGHTELLEELDSEVSRRAQTQPLVQKTP